WSGRANLVVSIVALHKGEFQGQRFLDGRSVQNISSFLEEGADSESPPSLDANKGKILQGSIILGDGFILSVEEGTRLVTEDVQNQDVVMPAPRGKEDINGHPAQSPG